MDKSRAVISAFPFFAKLSSSPKNRDYIANKSAEQVYGRPLEDIKLRMARKVIEESEKEKFGLKYPDSKSRPAAGALAFISEDDVETVLRGVLKENGLNLFEYRTLVQFYYKAIKLIKGKTYVEPAPVACDITPNIPRDGKGIASVIPVIAISDPQFVDETGAPLVDSAGNPLYRELPQEYIQALGNNFNPYVLYTIYANNQAPNKRLAKLLPLAGNNAKAFEQILKYNAKTWENKKAPQDRARIVNAILQLLLHEAGHILCLHMPDQVPASVAEKERQNLLSFGFDAYLKLLNEDQTVLASVAFSKNVFKALEEAADDFKDQPITPEVTDRVNEVLAQEMFCDRFSMFLYENFLKINMYREAFEKAGVPFTVDAGFLQKLEEIRKFGSGGLREMRGLKGAVSNEVFDQLGKDLAAAERDHFYIADYGDPGLTAKEYELFGKFHGLLLELEKQSSIIQFDMEHVATSRFWHASLKGLKRKLGAGVPEQALADLNPAFYKIQELRAGGRPGNRREHTAGGQTPGAAVRFSGS